MLMIRKREYELLIRFVKMRASIRKRRGVGWNQRGD